MVPDDWVYWQVPQILVEHVSDRVDQTQLTRLGLVPNVVRWNVAGKHDVVDVVVVFLDEFQGFFQSSQWNVTVSIISPVSSLVVN